MNSPKINITSPLTAAERFFVEKSIELLNQHTIDTYRLRLNSPKSILIEMCQVISSVEHGIMSEVYGEELRKEMLDLFNREKILHFKTISKSKVLNILSRGHNLQEIKYVCNILLADNKDFARTIFEKIRNEITRINAEPEFNGQSYLLLNDIIGYFYIELKLKGYSKAYLHHYLRSIFNSRKPIHDFGSAMTLIESRMTKPKEKYTVYIAFNFYGRDRVVDITSESIKRISQTEMRERAQNINELFVQFIEKYSNLEYYSIETYAADYYSAAYQIRNAVQRDLDLIFMGLSSTRVSVNPACFVVGDDNPTKGARQLLNYYLDGYFGNDKALYKRFLKIVTALERRKVDEPTKGKIAAAIRFLRLGTESNDLENKLINYWIGIEYLFSTSEKGTDKVSRLKEYFNKVHTISYTSKIFQYVHDGIKNMALGNVSKFNEQDLSYLIEDSTLDELTRTFKNYPLLAFRIYNLRNRFGTEEAIKSEFKRHQNNVERNIMRIYRIRNEIVHTASFENNIADVTAHLRYYLSYIINSFLLFLETSAVDLNGDGKISFSDYLSFMSLQLDDILSDKNLSIKRLLQHGHPAEFIK